MRLAVAAFAVLFSVAPAAALELDGHMVQGGFVVGTAASGARVSLDGVALPVSEDGRFVFGFGRDHGPEAELQVRYADGRTEQKRIEVAARDWKIERIDGLPPRKVTPSEEDLAAIRRESSLVKAALATDSDRLDFADGFIAPAKGRISGVYGSQRILNGEPRRPHFGIDFAAPTGSPVIAAAGGEVVLAETGLFYTGGLIVIDHGHGVTSLYLHLSEVAVRKGQEVAQGERIGAVGKSGRASGPHLDWRVNWRNSRLDPALLVDLPNN